MPPGDACFVVGGLIGNARIVIQEHKGPSLTIEVSPAQKEAIKKITPQLKVQNIVVKS